MVRAKDAPLITPKFLGHGHCDSKTRSVPLPMGIDSAEIIARECSTMLRNLVIRPVDLRGIGIQINQLEKTGVANGNKTLLDFMKKQNALDSQEPSTSVAPKRTIIRPFLTPTKIKKHSPSPRKRLVGGSSPSPRKKQKLLEGQKNISEMFNDALAKQKKQSESYVPDTNTPQLIDKDVFFNLPADVRKEYEDYYRSQGVDVQFLSMNSNDRPVEPRPSPPTPSPPPPPAPVNGKRKKSSCTVTTNELQRKPSPSLPAGIDPDVFYSLPKEMQEEILHSLMSQRPVSKTPPIHYREKQQNLEDTEEELFSAMSEFVEEAVLEKEPTDNASRYISKYLFRLVDEKRLDKIAEMAVIIRCTVHYSKFPRWIHTWDIIKTNIQAYIIGKYGAPMKELMFE